MDIDMTFLLSELERARARLNAVLDKVAPQAEIYPTWKLKQIYDHITGWDMLVVSTLEAISHAEEPERAVKHGMNRFNADSILARKELTLAQSREAYDTTRQHVLEMLRMVTPDVLSKEFHAPWGGMCTIASLVKDFIAHEQEHGKQIEAILAGLRSNS